MNNLFSYSFVFILIFIILLSCFSPDYSNFNINESDIYVSDFGYVWPVPHYTRISSLFGKRVSPTNYASTFHNGIDIPANEGTYFLASISGIVTYTGFNGSGGYTIIIENEDITVIYCHVSPDFLVNAGDRVEKAQVLGQVRTISYL